MKPALSALAASIAVSIATISSGVLAEDWPQYRGPLGDGKSGESILPTDIKNGELDVIWKSKTPLGFSSFSVADGLACKTQA